MEAFDAQNPLITNHDESHQGQTTNQAVNEDNNFGNRRQAERFTEHNTFTLDSDFGVGVVAESE